MDRNSLTHLAHFEQLTVIIFNSETKNTVYHRFIFMLTDNAYSFTNIYVYPNHPLQTNDDRPKLILYLFAHTQSIWIIYKS